ncbi:MAG: hypothetical protein U0V48_12215 [Anaerolineales bacterium]
MLKVIARVDDDREFFRFEYLGKPVRRFAPPTPPARATTRRWTADDGRRTAVMI